MLDSDANLITLGALTLEPHFSGEFRSKLTTTEGIFYSKKLTTELLNATCIKYGSTMDGRVEAVKEVFKYEKRTPFHLIPFDFGVFPTMSAESPECVWIFSQRFSIKEMEKGVCKITFLNGVTKKIDCSKHTLEKQQQRLHTVLDSFRQIHKNSSHFIEK